MAGNMGPVCEFAPKKPSGPLSRRCVHCGRHQDEHCADPVEQPVSNVDATDRESGRVPSPEPQVIHDHTGLKIEVMDKDCYLLRDLLGPEEQAALFQYIQDRDRTDWSQPRAMVPAPKTLVFGDNEPSLRIEPGQVSPVSDMVGKATEILKRNELGCSIEGISLDAHKSMTMNAIQYKSPDGRFPPHLDHCNGSFNYLMSLGCTANFMVQGPAMDSPNHFKFRSGDLLVFNASTEAAILHGVMSIDDEDTCPGKLGDAFQELRSHRYGVQCRLGY
jgi:hypothetical protein